MHNALLIKENEAKKRNRDILVECVNNLQATSDVQVNVLIHLLFFYTSNSSLVN